MLKKSAILMFPLLVIILVQHKHLWAYDGKVHGKITAAVTLSSELHSALKHQVGLEYGAFTFLEKNGIRRSVFDWISYGAEAEDYGIHGEGDVLSTRAFNHFHDPLEDWYEAGLSHVLLNTLYGSFYFKWPVSAILWGLDSTEQDYPAVRNTTGDWSWANAKNYLYLALTAPDKSARDANFVDCFRALGQVVHLLEDMSVPLHTRNDVHIFPIKKIPFIETEFDRPLGRWTYETYVSENAEDLNYSAKFPHSILLEDPQPDSQYDDLIPVTGLFDRNVYDGTALPMDTSLIGLAEYSNGYFLTEDTMWTYPHPSLEDTDLESFDWLFTEPVIAEDGKIDERIYLERTRGVRIRHLVAVDYFFEDYQDMITRVNYPFLLDEECWNEYASKLIPKAVGYSAMLINYFFRGRLRAVWKDEGLAVRNLSEETMHNGMFELFYEDSLGERRKVTISSGAVVSSLSPGQETTISYDTPCDSEEYCNYFLVYRGSLGDEDDTVIGQHFSIPELEGDEYTDELASLLRGIAIDQPLAAELGARSGYYRISLWAGSEPGMPGEKVVLVLEIDKSYYVRPTGWPYVLPKKGEEWVFSEIEHWQHDSDGISFKGQDLHGHTLEFDIVFERVDGKVVCHRVEFARLNGKDVMLTTQTLSSVLYTCDIDEEPPWTPVP